MYTSTISRFLFAALLVGGLLVGGAGVVHALPIIVPDFAADPTGPAFSINAIDPNVGLSNNIQAAPELTYGVLDPTTGVDDTLQMNWEPIDPNETSQAGWELVFGVDPDIRNMVLSLSISPPGQGSPQITPPAQAINQLEILVRDANGKSAGIWGFNTDQLGLIFLGNDPTALGKAPNALPAGVPIPPAPGPLASLQNNVMQTVTINLGTGPVAGSATIFDGFTTLIGPNYIFPSAGGSLASAASLEFYENGSLAGSLQLPTPGSPGLNNYWDHISLVPEPSSVMLLGIGLASLFGYGRRCRH